MPKRKNGGQNSMTFRVVNRKGTKVYLKGADEAPKAVVQSLEKYGFTYKGSGVWEDQLTPTGEILTDLTSVGKIAPIHISTTPPKDKRGKSRYMVEVGKAKVESKSVSEGLDKAYRAWNRGGREVGGVKLEAALNTAIRG